MTYEQKAKKLTKRLKLFDPLLEVRVQENIVSFFVDGREYITKTKQLDLYRVANGDTFHITQNIPMGLSHVLLRDNLSRAEMNRGSKYAYMNDINYYAAREKRRKQDIENTAIAKEFGRFSVDRKTFTNF